MRFRENGDDDEDDESDDEILWIVEISPSRDRRPRSTQSQVFNADDFDDVLEIVDSWAAVVARELAARGQTERARQQAKSDFADYREDAPRARPLELTEVSGLLYNELPDLIAEGFRAAGVQDEAEVREGVASVLFNRAEISDELRRIPTDQLEGFLAKWLLPRLKERLINEGLDVATSIVRFGLHMLIEKLH